MSTKRGCSLGDVGCGVQRSVELPLRVIKSTSAPTDVVDTQSAGLVSVHLLLRAISKPSYRTAQPLATSRATIYTIILLMDSVCHLTSVLLICGRYRPSSGPIALRHVLNCPLDILSLLLRVGTLVRRLSLKKSSKQRQKIGGTVHERNCGSSYQQS